MDYFNNHNSASFWSSSSSSWPPEVDPYEFLVQFSANEAANSTANTFTDRWSMYDQPGPMVDFQAATTNHGKHYRNLFVDWCLTVESPEPLASATSWVAQPDGDGQQSYSGQYWPTADHHAHPHGSWFPSMDDPFASTMGSGAPTVVPGPSSGKNIFALELGGTSTDRSRIGPFDYWEGNQSGPSMSTFYTVSARARSSLCNHTNTFP